MAEKNLKNGEAIGIGCIVSIGAYLMILMLFRSYFVLVTPIFIGTEFPLIIIGTFIGKHFTETRAGTWLGATFGAALAYRWFMSILVMVMPD